MPKAAARVSRGGMTDHAGRVDRNQELLGKAGIARRLRSRVPKTDGGAAFSPQTANARHRIGQSALIGAY
jgi:hypothetical protein